MQKHGPKRSPSEFKELRKQWRKQKKESEGPPTLDTPPHRMAMPSSYSVPLEDPSAAYPTPRFQPNFPSPLDVSFGSRYTAPATETSALHYPAQHSPREHDYPVSPQEHSWPNYQQPATGYPSSYYSPTTPSPSTPTYHPSPISPGHATNGPIPNLPFPFTQPSSMQSYARHEPRQGHYDHLRRHSTSEIEVLTPRSHSHSPPVNRLSADSTLLTPLSSYDSPPSHLQDLQYPATHVDAHHNSSY